MSLAARRRRLWIYGLAALTLAACTSSPNSAGITSAPPVSSSAAAATSSTPNSTAPSSSPTTTTTAALSTDATYAETPCWEPNYPGVPQLDLSPDFTCGYLTVPENRQEPDGRQIRVAVARVKAASPNPQPDPVLYLAGGPGGTGIVTAMQRVAGGINADRDVIFIDQLGTFHSDPALTCPEMDEIVNVMPTLQFSDPATVERTNAATAACRSTWADQGYDLASYNTAENAADIADLRVALGIDEWNVYGVSYGTYLIQTLLRDHPEGIRSVVLDSVVPVAANLILGFWEWPPLGNRALFDACAAQPDCAAAFPDLEKEFVDTVRALSDNPVTVDVPQADGSTTTVIVDGYLLANMTVVPTLAPGFLDKLPAAIHEIAGGDATAIAALAASPSPAGIVGWGLSLGVFCGEMTAWTSQADALASAKAANPQFPDEVLSPRVTQAPNIWSDCAVWDVPKSAVTTHDPVTSDVPALLMSGSLDAVTPPENADTIAGGLSASQHVVIPGAGHDVLLWDPSCSQKLMNAFLNNPGVAVDTSCLDGLSAPTFVTATQ